MTLDEAIKYCEEEAKEQRWKAKVWEDSDYPNEVERYLARAEEYEQLAKWLEELVELRSQRASECEWCKGCKEHDEENHCCHRLSNFIHTQAKEIHDMAYEEGKNDRPKGEWIHHEEWENEGGCGYECSCCGRTYDYDMNFCGYCGANMRGGAE